MVQWEILRLMLILICILVLHSQSVDLTNDFHQADTPNGDPVFIQLPRDFTTNKGKFYVVLRLKKILYGQAKAARL